jgi:hypothetical protein
MGGKLCRLNLPGFQPAAWQVTEKARKKGRHAITVSPPLSKKKAFFCQQLFNLHLVVMHKTLCPGSKKHTGAISICKETAGLHFIPVKKYRLTGNLKVTAAIPYQ